MKISKDSIGDRFKGYENASRHYHPRRLPLIIRVDGIAFHTLTRKLARPYDSDFMDVMVNTALHTAAKIQTCRFVYTQSDEISFLLINYYFFSAGYFETKNIIYINHVLFNIYAFIPIYK